MSLPSEKIQAIRERTDIVQLIGAHVSLRKAGRNYVGLCPFHQEKSPSFSVSAEKAMFYCFGCHAGGDVFAYVMRHDGLDFHAAARRLGTAVGIELEPESPAQKAQRISELATAEVNRLADIYFTRALRSAGGAVARQYLQSRNIPESFAKRRRLGFGGGHEELLRFLAEHQCTAEQISTAGLVSDDGRWQLFAGRLVFPILDLQGRVAGFGGRRLDTGETPDSTSPKYINSRENPLFHKRRTLYGLFEAQEAMRKSREVILVEGYTDVLAMQRAGLEQTVAALGTAFTADHAKVCGRLATQAIVLLDADAAGQRAALGATLRMLEAGLKTSVAPLPAGEDPDSVLRSRGPAFLKAQVMQARPAVEYFMDSAFAPGDMSIEDRAAAARQLQPLLNALSSGLERDLYMSRLAEKVGVSVDKLRQHLRPPRPRPSRDTAPTPRRDGAARQDSVSQRADAAQRGVIEQRADASTRDGVKAASSAPPAPLREELDVLRELLLYPSLRPRFGELAEFALSEPMRILMDALANTTESVNEVLKAHVKDQNWLARLTRIAPVADGALDEVIAKSNRTFEDVMARLKWRHVDAALRRLLLEMRELEERGEATDTLLRRKQELTERKRLLKRAGRTAQVVK